MIALAPVTLTGQTQTISFNAQVEGQAWPIRVANESTYALQIQVGGDRYWLDPGTVDVFRPAYRITQIVVLPTILTGSPSGSVLVTLAEQGEQFTGSYPMALPAQTSITTGTVNVGTITGNVSVVNASGTQLQTFSTDKTLGTLSQSNAGGGTGTVNVTPDTGCKSLFILSTTGTPTRVQVLGVQSGYTYFDRGLAVGLPLPPSGPIVFPYAVQSADTSLQVAVTYGGVGAATVAESFDVLPPTFQGVEERFSAAAPWQAASKGFVNTTAFSLGANGSHVLIAGIAGNIIIVHAIDWIEAISSTVNVFEDTTSAVQVGIDVPASRGGSNTAFIDKSIDGKSIALPSGAGLQMRNTNATASGNIWTAVRYTQQ